MAQQPIFGVTNIPKDILLELSGNVLKLKDGSICTKPDGTQFQTVGDLTYSGTTFGTDKYFVFRNATASSFAFFNAAHVISGTTAPASGTGYVAWYDTTNNLIKAYNNGTDTGTRLTMPLGIVSYTNGTGVTSIDRIFNGFGYMGSLYYVLPDVEGFYPNGKDGFNNLFQTVRHTNLSIYNITGRLTNLITFFNTNSNNLWRGFVIVDEKPEPQNMITWWRYYNKQDNFVYTYTGSSVLKDNSVPYGYITTTSSAPYSITSFEIVNPFVTITPRVISDYAKYLANLLIIQYNNKPKATMTIESVASMFPDELILAVRDGFNLETATGKQLDILAKYIGAERGYTNSSNQKAVLTDEEFRVLLKLKIIVNSGEGTLYGLETSLYNLFGTGIRVVEGKDAGGNPNMTLTYYVRSGWANVGLAASQQNVLPHPTGVGYTYNLSALTKYFGFIDYNDQNHPYSTGFRDYNNPTKQGEMYAYDKVIV